MQIVDVNNLLFSTLLPALLFFCARKKNRSKIMLVFSLCYIIFGSTTIIYQKSNLDYQFKGLGSSDFILTVGFVVVAFFAFYMFLSYSTSSNPLRDYVNLKQFSNKNIDKRALFLLPFCLYCLLEVVVSQSIEFDAPTSQGILIVFYAGFLWTLGYYIGQETREKDRFVAKVFLVIASALSIVIIVSLIKCVFFESFNLESIKYLTSNNQYIFSSAQSASDYVLLFSFMLFPLLTSNHRTIAFTSRVAYIILFVLNILTWSTTGITASFIALIIWLFLTFRRKIFSILSNRKLTVFFIFVGLIVVMICMFFHVLHHKSYNERIVLADHAFISFTQHPFFGIGANNFISTISKPLGYLETCHTSVMVFIVEFGIIGAFLFFLPFAYSFVRGFAQVRTGSPYGISLVAVLPSVLFLLLSDYRLTTSHELLLLVFVISFLLGECKLREHHPSLKFAVPKSLVIPSSLITVALLIVTLVCVILLKI